MRNSQIQCLLLGLSLIIWWKWNVTPQIWSLDLFFVVITCYDKFWRRPRFLPWEFDTLLIELFWNNDTRSSYSRVVQWTWKDCFLFISRCSWANSSCTSKNLNFCLNFFFSAGNFVLTASDDGDCRVFDLNKILATSWSSLTNQAFLPELCPFYFCCQ